ncbi:hypothetical protein Mapa_000981 [Marchantia paleacea]|nr:hypothetical protein Mapa_000981 [Marchantia paleacea]
MTTMDGSSITLSTWLGQHNILTTLIGIVGLFVYIFLNLLEKSIDYKSLRLPPGPQGWPLVGNLLQLGKLPHQVLTDLSKQYGSLMFLQLGSVPTLVVSSAEMAEEVFSTQDHLFASSRPRTLTGEILHYNNRGLILAPLGDQWRFMRRVATSNLFPVKRLEQFQWLTCKAAVVYEAVHYTESPLKTAYGGWQEVRREEILSMVKRALKEGHDGTVVQLSKKLHELAYNHTTQMLFGKSYFGPKSMKSENYKEAKAFQNMVASLSTGGCIMEQLREFIPGIRKLDSDVWDWKLWYFYRVYERFLSAIVKDHRQRPRTTGIQDVVDLILSLQTEMHRRQRTDENVKALLKDLITGGTETFSNQVEWTLAELMRHPEIRQKVQRELDFVVGKDRVVEESDLARLKYLHAVVKESFRLHPVLPLCAPMESTIATKIGGFELPSKTRVVINLYAIQRDPKVWDNPLAFNPDRFRRRSSDVKGEDFELLPFGAGRRICVGLNLGLSIVQFTLAQLLHTCDLALPIGMKCDDVDMEEGCGPTMPKARPLLVLVTPRLPLRVYKGL